MAKDKLTIVINGRGGAGKDAMCSAAAKGYRVRVVSSVDPIKKLAAQVGWQGEKTLEARKFLAELKRICSEYNDTPNKYCTEAYESFMESDDQILFVHIREPEQIERFRQSVNGDCIALLVRRGAGQNMVYGNSADDDVENYEYDCIYQNDAPLPESRKAFLNFIDEQAKKYAPDLKRTK